LYQIKAYIKFLVKSQNQHRLHSPFVYDLATKCFYDKTRYFSYKIIKEYQDSLLNNHDYIHITDFGAGSRFFKSDKRQISALARKVGISKARAELLNRLVKYLDCKSALELGTSLGIGSTAIAAGNKVKVTTIEGCPEIARIAKLNFDKFKLHNIHLEVGSFDDVLCNNRVWKEDRPENDGNKIPLSFEETKPQKLDLVYFDGNHKKEATLKYFEMLLPNAHNESIFIFDDIHWSQDMEEAWKIIKKHPSVRVSIDTFYWGLVFFRQEQAKQHFKIRM